MFSFKRSLIALVGVLVIVGMLATLMPLISRGQGGNPLTRDPRKSYYLTPIQHNGGQALTACAAGYHMASLWEIFDTSNLKYDTQLGVTRADSGFGPPNLPGWIRTGNGASRLDGAGASNCNAWTSSDIADFGTIVALPALWDSTDVRMVNPWLSAEQGCSSTRSVWCVQD